MVRTDFIKKIVDAFQLDANLEQLPNKVASSFVPVINLKIPPKIVHFKPTEAELDNGITVPSGKKWRIIALWIQWTSDANAGNRQIFVDFYEPTPSVQSISVESRNFQIASKVIRYSFFIGAGDPVGAANAEAQSLPLPQDFFLTAGGQIFAGDREGIAVGDAALSRLVVEESDLDTDEYEERSL